MPPQQTSPYGQAPSPLGEYDFIMSSGYKRPNSMFMGSSNTKRIIVVLVGAGALLIAAWIFLAILSGANGSQVTALTSLAQKQTELARVSDLATTQATQPSTKYFAQTTELSLLTDQQAFIKFLSKHGTKVDPKTLSLTKNSQTDSALQAAQVNGNYDQEYISIMQSSLASYEQTLRQTFLSTSSISEKQLLNSAYDHAQLLVELSDRH